MLFCFGAYGQSSFFWQNIVNTDSLNIYSDSILAMPSGESNRIAKNIQISALRNRDSLLYASSLGLETKSRFINGELNQSLALQNEALAIFQKYKNKEGQCAALITLALIDFENGNLYQARSKLRNSTKLALEINNHYYHALSEYHIAQINFTQQQYSKSKKGLIKAKSILESADLNLDLEFAIFQQLALIEIEFGQLSRAYDLLNKTKQKALHPDYLYNLNLNWSKYWQAMLNPQKAEEAGIKALLWANAHHSPTLSIEAQINLSEVYILKKNNQKSIEFAQQAKNLHNNLPAATSLKLQVLNQLHKVYLASADTAKALTALLQLNTIQDSLKSFELVTLPFTTTKPKTRIDTLPKTDTLEASVSSSPKRILIKAKGKEVIIGLIIFSAIAFIIGLITSILLFKQKRELKKLKTTHKKLSEKEEQISIEQLELKKDNQQLKDLDKNKNKVFSILTHDIRQPINQVKSVLELLEMEDLTKKDRVEIVQKLRESIDNSSNALENLLLWSKKQLTGINTKIVDVHLLPQVWQIESQVKANLDSKNLKLDIHVPDFLKVKADMSQLDICLRNLVNNAIKFSNSGGVITIEAVEENGDKIIRVIDNGVGMSIDQVDKLKNMKGDFTTLGTMNEKGTGLGVLITREFMQNQNGELDIQSRKGEGSIFSMIFHEAPK
ncbi:signal transduction histidine kinase [Owenweeksia hongkongensis DSM 17368]|uniref:histidine kinase n=1 Tax=Owenweeksia hongkongensis (strain DSM 17368 / CIP 108786 / JCM 12287 / NRRL B-23963 / UST20020801) TaxID=926562 RepID=G8QZ71_OWEHD|nr:signal transduction histidine kinase [Owenweeksia hongkongensis DSM 17368]